MPTSCIIEPDLSDVRFIGDMSERWSALPLIGDQRADAETLRARAVQAAEWVAKTVGLRRRLSLVCTSVGQANCVWLRAPSVDEPVLAASLRTATQDWGDRTASGSIEPLTDAPATKRTTTEGIWAALRRPVGRPASASTLEGCVVISTPSSLTRLWLDDLDSRGVRTDAVLTLWHAMAIAWGDEPREHAEAAACILHQPGRGLVWCWARGRDLLVGGTVMNEPPEAPGADHERAPNADPAARVVQRLALDWLAWSAHLGVSPASVTIIGEGAAALRQQLVERWPNAPILEHASADPVADTVGRAAERFSTPSDLTSRRCLQALTSRPNRAVRTHYRWAAAALVLLAAAVGILGIRMSGAAGLMSAAALQSDSQARVLVESLNDPSLLTAPNLVKSLESRAITLRSREPPKPPPEPRPIRDEIHRVADQLAQREGVRLVQVSLDMRQPNSLQLIIPDRRTGEEITLALQQNPGALLWAVAGGGGDQTLRLNGTWSK